MTIVFAIALARTALGTEVVYNNATNSLGRFFNPQVEFGDEIILASSTSAIQSCTVTSLAFEYVGENFHGDERARLRFYLNDGLPVAPGARAPGTLVYDSGFFNIVASATGFPLQKSGLLVTNIGGSFTWTIEFSGVSDSETAGLVLYSPPVVGNNYDDYWEKNGGQWKLKKTPGLPMNFGAVVEATGIVLAAELPIRLQMLGITNGLASLSILGPSGRNFVVETSPDCSSWQVMTNFTSAAAATMVFDPAPASLPQRFYRVRRTATSP